MADTIIDAEKNERLDTLVTGALDNYEKYLADMNLVQVALKKGFFDMARARYSATAYGQQFCTTLSRHQFDMREQDADVTVQFSCSCGRTAQSHDPHAHEDFPCMYLSRGDGDDEGDAAAAQVGLRMRRDPSAGVEVEDSESDAGSSATSLSNAGGGRAALRKAGQSNGTHVDRATAAFVEALNILVGMADRTHKIRAAAEEHEGILHGEVPRGDDEDVLRGDDEDVLRGGDDVADSDGL